MKYDMILKELKWAISKSHI